MSRWERNAAAERKKAARRAEKKRRRREERAANVARPRTDHEIRRRFYSRIGAGLPAHLVGGHAVTGPPSHLISPLVSFADPVPEEIATT